MKATYLGISINDLRSDYSNRVTGQMYAKAWYTNMACYNRAKKYGVRSENLVSSIVKLLKKSKTCYYCDKPLTLEEKTIDHKIAMSHGGSNTRDNLVVSCFECNHDKGIKENNQLQYLSKRVEKYYSDTF